MSAATSRGLSFLVLACAAVSLGAPAVHAHGDGTGHQASAAIKHGEDSSTPFGHPGNAGSVSRTVLIRMSDTMRFTPDSVTVRRGETIRFVARNEGKLMHEIVLGSEQSLREHAALMGKSAGMRHDEPFMVHVASGKTGELVWTFDKPGTIGFACLIPEHFEAGMKGKVFAR